MTQKYSHYKPITGDVTRNKVNVSTADSHGLLQNDIVDININPGIKTTITVKYNDFNRRLVINPRTFAALDIDNNNNSIKVEDHRFNTGDKVRIMESKPISKLKTWTVIYANGVNE